MAAPKLYVARDGTETWKVRYRHDGRGCSQTFARRRDAVKFARWLDSYGPEGALKTLGAQQSTTHHEPTLAEWCVMHIDGLSGVTRGTIDGYRRYVRLDLGDLGPMPVSAITRESVGRWVTWMIGRGQAGKTIQNKHGFLFGVMGRAVRKGMTDANPFAGTKIPETIKRDMTTLTRDEYQRFLGCFTAQWIPLVQLLFGTGMRFGEATALTVGDLDLDAGMLSITKAWKKDGTLGPPKSKKSVRTLTLTDGLVSMLRMQVDGRSGGELVFATAAGARITSSQFHMRVWQPALALANGETPTRHRGRGVARTQIRNGIEPLNPPLGKRPRVHDARHTCASWMLREGVPVFDVSRHLGHESIVTTTQVYGHLLPSAQNHIRAALAVSLSEVEIIVSSPALSASRPELLP